MTRGVIVGVYFLAILGTTGFVAGLVVEAVGAMGQVYSNIDQIADPEYSFDNN